MANKVTGSTDTSGAISTMARSAKAILVVGKAGTNPAKDPEVIFSVSGTGDAATKFGADSTVVEIVKTLITNGATLIYGLIVDDMNPDYTDEADAYDAAMVVALEKQDIKCIVVDTIELPILKKVVTHLDVAENEDMLRYLCAGLPEDLDRDELILYVKTNFNHKRVFTPYPNVVDDDGIEQDGIYTAAGLAALIMTETNDPALPMNGVTITGFGGVAANLLFSERDIYANNGITALFNSPSNQPTVHRLVTTRTLAEDGTKDEVYQEGTTIMIADYVLESVINRLRANFKRTKNVVRILDAIRTDVIDVLNDALGREIVEEFDPKLVSVVKDPDDRYGALVDYTFKVVTPLYTITVTQHLKI